MMRKVLVGVICALLIAVNTVNGNVDQAPGITALFKRLLQPMLGREQTEGKVDEDIVAFMDLFDGEVPLNDAERAKLVALIREESAHLNKTMDGVRQRIGDIFTYIASETNEAVSRMKPRVEQLGDVTDDSITQ
eukprot:Lankesteria_metandrocarpae@DN5300_c1_g1_i1.p3